MNNELLPAAEVRPAEDLAALAGKINEQHRLCADATVSALEHARHAGDLLLAAKKQAGHGQWLPWLEANCTFSERTAQSYMRVAREWARLTEANPQRAADLSCRDAARLLADPPPSAEEIAAEPCRVPMPAFRPGMCYLGHSDRPLEFGKPVCTSVEIVPSEQEGYWRYALLYLIGTRVRDDKGESEPDGYIDYCVRGMALNNKRAWNDVTRDFALDGDWWEYPKANGGIVCHELTDECAKKIRLAQILGGKVA